MPDLMLPALRLWVLTGFLSLIGLLAFRLSQGHGPATRSFLCRSTLAAIIAGSLLTLATVGRIPALWHLPLPETAASLVPTETVPASGPLAMSPTDVAATPTISPTNPATQSSAEEHPSSGPAALRVNRRGVGLTRSEEAGLAPHRENRFWFLRLLLPLWLLGSLLLLLWLSVCRRHLTRLRRQGRALRTGEAADLLAQLCAARNVSPPALLTSPHVHSPFLAGVRRPTLFLPTHYAADFSTSDLRAVLAHEVAHLTRRDCAWLLLARLCCAGLWPQPLLWLLVRRLEQAAEECCDQEAVAQAGSARAYADCLLRLAARCTPARREHALGAGVLPFRSAVGRRIHQILQKGPSAMSPLSFRVRLAVTCGAAFAATGTLLLLSVVGPPAKNALAAAPVATSATADADQARFLAGLTPVQGPGITVRLTDSAKPLRKVLPPGKWFPSLIHDSDINQVVNDLRAAGAEALAVNDQRLVATSAIRCLGPIVYVNSTPQTPPYIIRAIGDPIRMAAALNLSGAVADQLRQLDPAMIRIESSSRLTLPAYTGAMPTRYAQPIAVTPTAEKNSVAFIKGRIEDPDTGKGLPDVKIFSYSGPNTSVLKVGRTDPQGHFTIPAVPGLTHFSVQTLSNGPMRVSTAGGPIYHGIHSNVWQEVTLEPGQTKTFSILLHQSRTTILQQKRNVVVHIHEYDDAGEFSFLLHKWANLQNLNELLAQRGKVEAQLGTLGEKMAKVNEAVTFLTRVNLPPKLETRRELAVSQRQQLQAQTMAVQAQKDELERRILAVKETLGAPAQGRE